MKKEMTGYYSYGERQLEELWSKGLFVFDSSVLLGLYRFPEATSRDLIRILNSLVPRIWIPHQVALEYQENRLSVIREQAAKYNEVISVLADSITKLTTKLDQLQLGKRHSFIEPTDFFPRIEQTFDELLNGLRKKQAEHPDLYQHDPIRAELDTLFADRVGPAPESQEELDKIYQEGDARYGDQRPPGYEDAKKAQELQKRGESGAYFFNGLRLEKRFGDLILWHQTLSELRDRDSVNSVAFITDDEKGDWWWKEKLPASRTLTSIGARPELIQEATTSTNVSLFQMYTSSTFMDAAKKYLNLDIAQDSIRNADEIVRTRTESSLIRKSLQERGPLEVWQLNHDQDAEAWLASLEDGRYGVMIVEILSGVGKQLQGYDFRERTSYIPEDGSLQSIRESLSKLGTPVEKS